MNETIEMKTNAERHGAAASPVPPPGAAADWTVPQHWDDLTDEDHWVWDTLFARQKTMLHDRAVRVEERALQRDLALEVVEVARGVAVRTRDEAGAAAVVAGALAERQVHVQRQRARDRVVVAAQGGAQVFALAEIAAKVRGGRVGGVARARHVVAREQLGVELDRGGDGGDHDASVRPAAPPSLDRGQVAGVSGRLRR